MLSWVSISGSTLNIEPAKQEFIDYMEEKIRIGIKAINNDSPYNENFDTYFEIFFENIVAAVCMESLIPMPTSIDPMTI